MIDLDDFETSWRRDLEGTAKHDVLALVAELRAARVVVGVMRRHNLGGPARYTYEQWAKQHEALAAYDEAT